MARAPIDPTLRPQLTSRTGGAAVRSLVALLLSIGAWTGVTAASAAPVGATSGAGSGAVLLVAPDDPTVLGSDSELVALPGQTPTARPDDASTADDDRKIWLVVGGLVFVALALTALTVRYWMITRPSPARATDDGPVNTPATRSIALDLDDDDVFVNVDGADRDADHAGADDDWRPRTTGELPAIDRSGRRAIARPTRSQRAAALRSADR